MITQDAKVAGQIPSAKAYLMKMDDGIIAVVNKFGELIGDTTNVVVDNGAGQITTATVTIVPDGWYEDIANAD